MNKREMQRYLETICTRIAKLKLRPEGRGGAIVALQELAESVSRALAQTKQPA